MNKISGMKIAYAKQKLAETLAFYDKNLQTE